MTAIHRKNCVYSIADIESLLPWRAANALDPTQRCCVDAVLAENTDLALEYEAIRAERAAIAALHDDLGSPSPRALEKLFAAIDAELRRT